MARNFNELLEISKRLFNMPPDYNPSSLGEILHEGQHIFRCINGGYEHCLQLIAEHATSYIDRRRNVEKQLLAKYKDELAEQLKGVDVEMIAEAEGKVEAIEECLKLLET